MTFGSVCEHRPGEFAETPCKKVSNEEQCQSYRRKRGIGSLQDTRFCRGASLPATTADYAEAPKLLYTRDLGRHGYSMADVRAGTLQQIAPGAFVVSEMGGAELDLISVALRKPVATLCLESGLVYHGLLPASAATRTHLAVPYGARRSVGYETVQWHVMDRPTFHHAVEEVPLPGTGLSIRVYTAERCIADLIRIKGWTKQDAPGVVALRAWLDEGNQPEKLILTAVNLPIGAMHLAEILDSMI